MGVGANFQIPRTNRHMSCEKKILKLAPTASKLFLQVYLFTSRGNCLHFSNLKGRKETIVTVGGVGPRRRGLDLPFGFRVAVGPAEISERFRGKTVSNGLQTA